MTEGLLLSREEIVRSHDYVRPHVEAGYRLHGGYVATGEYRSPRTLVRGPAVERWAEALVGNGGELIDVSRSILPTPIWPNLQQSRLLMEKGLDRTLWNLLTATGIVEARGGILRTVAAPDFQSIVVEDLGPVDSWDSHLSGVVIQDCFWEAALGVMDRLVLSDDQWETMSGLIIGRPDQCGSTGRDNRMFVEGVLWIVRTGSPWRDLPEAFGEWNSVFRRFSRWSEKGVWRRIFEALSDDPDFEYLIVDSTIVRAHQHSCGAKGGLAIRPSDARAAA
jgi:transposase